VCAGGKGRVGASKGVILDSPGGYYQAPLTDSEDNRPLLHPEGQLVHKMEREACTGKRGALLRDMEDTGLDNSYMPNPREGAPALVHMSKVCNREDRS
jgi:hypothetical protein